MVRFAAFGRAPIRRHVINPSGHPLQEERGGAAVGKGGETLDSVYGEFIRLLEAEDRAAAVRLALAKLESGELDIPTLYSRILAPSLNDMRCSEDEDTCIWKEHVRSSFVRAVIESCYPHVLKARERALRKEAGDRVLVACPTEEYHEIGARMVADFFTLAGFETTFIGANTPRRVILSAARHVRPRYLAMSVTNNYNLFDARQIIGAVKSELGGSVTVVVGGSAFKRNRGAATETGADLEIHTYEEIAALPKGG